MLPINNVREAKKICGSIAKIIKEFWLNADKVVNYRSKEILQSQKRKALDQHLNFLVGEADKLSNILQEGFTKEVCHKELDNIAEEALEFQPKGYTLETTQVIFLIFYIV